MLDDPRSNGCCYVTVILAEKMFNSRCWKIYGNRKKNPGLKCYFFTTGLNVIFFVLLCFRFDELICINANNSRESFKGVPMETLVLRADLCPTWSATIFHWNNHEKGQILRTLLLGWIH